MEKNGIKTNKLEVVIVGSGLVGSLEALYLARRGYKVHLYEFREDIRKTPHVRGRSINLALSHRGRLALRDVGLEHHVIKDHAIPMKARLIHNLDGSCVETPYDPNTKQCIYSVGRNYLNELLLNETEKYQNVHRYFNHKLTESNLEKGILKFLKTGTNEIVQVEADLTIGADGAFSTVRKNMMKQPLFDFSQQYIEHGYLELCIPPNNKGQFQMKINYLHIWPRGTFMMIALPNQDASWTVTLFMPFNKFRELDTPETLLDFFNKQFPDAVSLIGKDKLIDDFFSTSPSPLVAIKCRPYHITDRALLIGDAAHAVVPFYGQGMNAGFEDCYILNKLLQKHSDNVAEVLKEFSYTRWEDAHAISDLAMYNYIEMRDLVTRRTFKMRKALDYTLNRIMPNVWIPLYHSVTFTSIPYSQCVKNNKWQDKVLTNGTYLSIVICIFWLVLFTLT